MPESLLVASRDLRDALASFEPDVYAGEDCATLAEELARTGKACVATAARAAERAAGCGAHVQRGYAQVEDWLARSAGSSRGQAREALSTAAALKDRPETRNAVSSGELSLAQGAEIAKTEAVCPGSESELVGLAKSSSLGVLRDTARSRRLRAADVEELHRQQHSTREIRHWTDDMGMVRGSFALPPMVGVPIVNRLEAETDRIREVARRNGSDEPRAAHAADALVKLLAGKGKGKADRADMTIVYDRTAALSGDGEETAHIIGGGPIPVEQARKMAERSFVKAVIHDGKRIETVMHVGRTVPAELRTALGLGDPPNFEGFICIDCGKRYGVQRDHVNPVANGGITSYDNLRGRCWDCHEKKTQRDREAGLLGGNGRPNQKAKPRANGNARPRANGSRRKRQPP